MRLPIVVMLVITVGMPTAPAQAEDVKYEAPFGAGRVNSDYRPDRAGFGTATGEGSADAATGRVMAAASSTQQLPGSSANASGVGRATAATFAGVEQREPVGPGIYFVSATIEDIRASATVEEGSVNPNQGAVVQGILSAHFFPDGQCCTPLRLPLQEANTTGDFVECSFRSPFCTRRTAITLGALTVTVPEGTTGVLQITAGLLSESFSGGTGRADVTATGVVTRLVLHRLPWLQLESGADWVLYKAQAAEQATTAEVRFRGYLRRTSGPRIVGFGFGADQALPGVFVIPIGSGPRRITTTTGAGAVDITIDEVPGLDLLSFHVFWTPSLAARQEAAMLVFDPGSELAGFRDYSTESSAPLATAVISGRGSTAILAADPRDSGAAVGLGPAAAGSSAHSEQVDRGLVGAFATFGFCGACTGSWDAPQGRGGTWTAAGSEMFDHSPLLESGEQFAGPAGEWRWTWNGAGVTTFRRQLGNQPTYAAWAPVGEDWKLFGG